MIFLFHSYFTLRVKKRRYIGKKYSPAKGVGRVYRREGSNPSFSAKQQWALLHEAVPIVQNSLRRDLYARL